jgi:hypothetical protein
LEVKTHVSTQRKSGRWPVLMAAVLWAAFHRTGDVGCGQGG